MFLKLYLYAAAAAAVIFVSEGNWWNSSTNIVNGMKMLTNIRSI